MATRMEIPEKDGMYFVTFTCQDWLSLFEITNGYGAVYDWFDHLKSLGHYINGYCIMPNHLHAIFSFSTRERSVNVEIGEGKRFLAYKLVDLLIAQGNYEMLIRLRDAVSPAKKAKGQRHEVWEPSFDWKACRSNRFALQKLNYMHANPCAGKWKLARSPLDYPHSSASFYETGKGAYPVTHYLDMEDIAFIDLKKRSP